MRKWVEGTFMMAALPWLQTNSFLDRELGINLTPFNSDMLDWRNNLWNDNPNRPRSDWRQYLLTYHYSVTADSAQGTEWHIRRTIPTLEFLRFDGGIYTRDSEGKIRLNDGTEFSGAKTIGFNPFNLINYSINSIRDGLLIDNVQDAIDSLSQRVSMIVGIRNVMDIEKADTNNMQLCGTITTAFWQSQGVQKWTSRFYEPWYPRRSAIFGGDHDVFRGENLLVSGRGNFINNDSKTETANSLIVGLENKVLCSKEHIDNEITYNLTNSIFAGQHNETMNSVSDSIIGGYGNYVESIALNRPGFSINVVNGTTNKPVALQADIVTIAADGYSSYDILEASEKEMEGGAIGISGLLVAGGKNRVFNTGHSAVAGYGNVLADASNYSAIFGIENSIYDKSIASFISGAGNYITESSVHSVVFGAGNGIYNNSTASFIAGTGNKITDNSVFSAVLGAGNGIYNNSTHSFVVGAGNQIANGSVHSAIFGAGNGLYNGSTASFVAGAGNRVTDGSVHSVVFGSGNGIHNHSTQSFVAGTGNIIATGSVHSAAVGAGNKITETSSQSFAAGGGNLITYSESSAVFGRDNIISHSDFSFAAGIYNKIENSAYSTAFGEGNYIYGDSIDGFIAGYRNEIGYSARSAIFGTANYIADHSYESFIAGIENIIEGESWHSASLGGRNQIYGSHEAFVTGWQNQIDNGYHSVVFGQGNILKNAADSLVAGRGHNILGGDCVTAFGSYHNIPAGAQASNVAILGGSGLTPVASDFAVTDRLSINSRLLLLGDGTYPNPVAGDVLMVEGLENVTGINGSPKSIPKVKWSNALTEEVKRATEKEANLQLQINAKQDKLIAGTNIDISGNTISATGATIPPSALGVPVKTVRRNSATLSKDIYYYLNDTGAMNVDLDSISGLTNSDIGKVYTFCSGCENGNFQSTGFNVKYWNGFAQSDPIKTVISLGGTTRESYLPRALKFMFVGLDSSNRPMFCLV